MPTTGLEGGRQQNDRTATDHENLLSLKRQHSRPDAAKPAISSDETLGQALTFYPAYCHPVSPTWFTWVKLTSHAIRHTLSFTPSGYHHSLAGQYRTYHPRREPRVCFFLNHPIQFVQIVGVVTVVESYFDKFWLFTVDDGSGATVDVVCRKPNGELREDRSEEEKREDEEVRQLSDCVQTSVDIGVVVQVKGVITLFQRLGERKMELTMHGRNAATTATGSYRGGTRVRVSDQAEPESESGVRQILLSRIRVVRDTMQELSLISARTKFHNDVLSRPWHVSAEKQQELRQRVLGEHDRDRDRAKRHKLHEQRRTARERDEQRRIETEYAVEEREREKEAERVRRAVLDTNGARNVNCKGAGTTGRVHTHQDEDNLPDTGMDIDSTTFFHPPTHAPRQPPSRIQVTADPPRKPISQSRPHHKKHKQKNKSTRATLQNSKPDNTDRSRANGPSASIHMRSDEQKKPNDESFGIDDEEKSALLRVAFGLV